MGRATTSKRLLQITFEFFQNSPEFSSQWSSQMHCFWSFEILRLRFLTIFFRKFEIHHCSLYGKSKTSIIWKTSDRRAKPSEIWGSWVVLHHVWGTFGLVALKFILGSFGALAIFRKCDSQKTLLLIPITAKFI